MVPLQDHLTNLQTLINNDLSRVIEQDSLFHLTNHPSLSYLKALSNENEGLFFSLHCHLCNVLLPNWHSVI